MHDLSIMSRMGCRAAWADSTRGKSAGQHGQHEQHGHGSIWDRHSRAPPARKCFARNDRLLRGVFHWNATKENNQQCHTASPDIYLSAHPGRDRQRANSDICML